MQDLVSFYYDKFKPVYSYIQQTNKVPNEMLFEINAAFDHWTRIIYYGEDEAKTIRSVCAHLKRGCFDAFKIIVYQTREQYNELKQTDLSLIDNGEFVKSLNRLWADIEKLAVEARMSEGDSRDEEKWHDAFDKWENVIYKCSLLTQNFFLSDKVKWAKDKQRRSVWMGFALGVVASLVAAGLFELVKHYCF
jgi:hypothetical protein